MHKLTTLSAAALVAVLATSASAQNLRSTDGPAETPPDSYTGKQYVDSNGCVFIRAGYDGAVTWVPRVDRQRKVVCGGTPTFADASPVPLSNDTFTAATIPTPEPVYTPTPAPAPAPTPVIYNPPAPEPEYAYPPYSPPPTYSGPHPDTVITTCPNLSAVGQRYVSDHRRPVRCGPQMESPYYVEEAGAYPPGYYGHVLSVSRPPVIAPPPGYKAAFDDGRFNPHRGPVTKEGDIQMRLVWRDGVPMRLVTKGTERYYVVNGQPTKDREYVLTHNEYGYYHGKPAYFGGDDPYGGVIVSTKGEEPPVATPAVETPSVSVPAGHRFVQVGLFTTDEKARASAARLKSLGLPVQLGRATHKGNAYLVVLAGPFNSPIALQTGLNAVRGAGYTGAKTR